MPVDHFRRPSFRLEFPAVYIRVVLIHGRFALPERIHIGEHRQVIEFIVPGKFRSFPDLTLRPSHRRPSSRTLARPALALSLAPIARPAPTESPCPSDPVAASTPGILGVGWPSEARSKIAAASSRAIPETRARLSQSSMRAREPRDPSSTNRSPSGEFGFVGSNFTWHKKMCRLQVLRQTWHEVGWPDPAAVVSIIERMLSLRAFSFTVSIAVLDGPAGEVMLMGAPSSA